MDRQQHLPFEGADDNSADHTKKNKDQKCRLDGPEGIQGQFPIAPVKDKGNKKDTYPYLCVEKGPAVFKGSVRVLQPGHYLPSLDANS